MLIRTASGQWGHSLVVVRSPAGTSHCNGIGRRGCESCRRTYVLLLSALCRLCPILPTVLEPPQLLAAQLSDETTQNCTSTVHGVVWTQRGTSSLQLYDYGDMTRTVGLYFVKGESRPILNSLYYVLSLNYNSSSHQN